MKMPSTNGHILMRVNNMEPQDLDKDEWGLPHEFEEPPLPEWPRDVFASSTQQYVNELTRSTETPPELACILTLATISTAAQRYYRVEIKIGYRETINIYALAILIPGSRKSAVQSENIAPLKKWEEMQRARLSPLIDAERSKNNIRKEKIKHLTKLILKANTNLEYSSLENEILQLNKEIDSTPKLPQLWTSDITPERLGAIMADNNDAMSILSDEGGIFDILAGLYSKGTANIDLFLQAHSGSSVRIDRGSRDPILLERALLTIALTVQPHVIKNACRNITFRERGLLGRFLYVIPKSNIGYRTLEEEPMDSALKNEFDSRITAILNNAPQTNNIQNIHILQLEPEAYAKWLEYAQTIEKMMNPDLGILSHITDWAGKLCGEIGRIAALLHIDRYAFEKPWEKKISLQEVEKAIKIGHALMHHALKVFSLIDEESGISVAKEILQWITNLNIEKFTRRECLRRLRKYSKNILQPGLTVLKEHGYIHEGSDKPLKGAPSAVYYVNPHYKSMSKGQKGH